MNIFTTLCLSLENAKIETANKIFVLFKTDNQPIAYITFDNKNEMSEIDKYHNILNINSLIGFNVKYNLDNSEELSQESFIQQVYVHSAIYLYTNNSGVERVSSIIPIVMNGFDISDWNIIFTEKFDSSWSNVCKYVYYNKYQLKYGIKNCTFRQDDKRCVPTKSGKLYILEKSTTIDMNENCTLRGFPITWIVMNWLKNGSTQIREHNNIISVEPVSKILFDRVKQIHKYDSKGGIEIFVLENDCLITYRVYKSCIKRNGLNVDQKVIEAILKNPDVWSGSRWDGLKRMPLLTNKDAE